MVRRMTPRRQDTTIKAGPSEGPTWRRMAQRLLAYLDESGDTENAAELRRRLAKKPDDR